MLSELAVVICHGLEIRIHQMCHVADRFYGSAILLINTVTSFTNLPSGRSLFESAMLLIISVCHLAHQLTAVLFYKRVI